MNIYFVTLRLSNVPICRLCNFKGIVDVDQDIVEFHGYMDIFNYLKEVRIEAQSCSQVLVKCVCN